VNVRFSLLMNRDWELNGTKIVPRYSQNALQLKNVFPNKSLTVSHQQKLERKSVRNISQKALA
jgi:hypothetical protein